MKMSRRGRIVPPEQDPRTALGFMVAEREDREKREREKEKEDRRKRIEAESRMARAPQAVIPPSQLKDSNWRIRQVERFLNAASSASPTVYEPAYKREVTPKTK